MTRSIRVTLVRRLVTALICLLGTVLVLLYLGVRSSILASFDHSLLVRANAIALSSRSEESDGRTEVKFEIPPRVWDTTDAEPASYFQVWLLERSPTEGSAQAVRVVEKSPSLGVFDLPRLGGVSVRDATLPGGVLGRVFSVVREVPADPEDYSSPTTRHPTIEVSVARSRLEVDSTLNAVGGFFAISFVVIVGAVVVIASRTVRRGLAPAAQLADAVVALDPARLPSRLPIPSARAMPTELAPVVAGIDDLLTRLNSAMERERRFTAAAAHELRSPIAELTTMLDVRLKWPESPQACERTLREAREVTARMQRLTELLLDLARADGSPHQPPCAPINLVTLVVSELRLLDSTLVRRRLSLSVERPEALVIASNPAALESIISNLLSNAAHHAPENSKIILRLTASPATLTVTNRAPDLSEADIPHLFEPFWQKDAARTPGSTHTGLGLALAATLARHLPATLIATLADDELILTLRLPDSTRCL